MKKTPHSDPATQWSRRALLLSAATAPAVAVLATPAHAQQAQKLAQSVVQYQQTPKNGQECDGCVNFIAPNQCKLVQGPINPKGWCIAFAPKTS